MKNIDIKNLKIARKYANALLESAIKDGVASEIFNELTMMIETVSINEKLKKFIQSPIVKNSDKKEVMEKIFSSHVSKTLLDFIYLLIDNSRLNTLNEILDCYNNEYNKINNIITPKIISAVELTEEQKNKITEKISHKLSKKIIPQYELKEEIIGGIIVEIGDKTIDCSIKTKFENMRKQLIKGNRYGSD